jgi:hypothetical protein
MTASLLVSSPALVVAFAFIVANCFGLVKGTA